MCGSDRGGFGRVGDSHRHLYAVCVLPALQPNLKLENPDVRQTDALLCLADAIWYDNTAAARKQKRGVIMEIMKLNEQITFLRKQKGMTQEEVACALGVTNHEPVIIRLNQEKPINWGFALI